MIQLRNTTATIFTCFFWTNEWGFGFGIPRTSILLRCVKELAVAVEALWLSAAVGLLTIQKYLVPHALGYYNFWPLFSVLIPKTGPERQLIICRNINGSSGSVLDRTPPFVATSSVVSSILWRFVGPIAQGVMERSLFQRVFHHVSPDKFLWVWVGELSWPIFIYTN